MATCFVIMPLTTPEILLPQYGQDADHFSHVLEHLFIPAIKLADFEPIPPIAQGADVIHGEIIKNLETADLVLCDISALNPNVFFELGCRTALNKPVCYVMDDRTQQIPFDTGIINHHTYSHALAAWTLKAEVQRLSAHVRLSASRSAGKNMLWQYFGLRSTAHAAESQGAEQDRLGYLVMQLDAIKKRLDDQPNSPWGGTTTYQIGPGLPWTDPLPAQAAYGWNQTISISPKQDWEREISNAETDFKQMARLKKGREGLPDLKDVKWLIEQHIKSLGEIIESGSDTTQKEKARTLQSRYLTLLPRKQPR